MQDPQITIGFVPRERFSTSAEALERLFAHTRLPFRLLVVECGTPAPYRRAMDAVLAGRTGVEILESDTFLLPNQSKSRVLQATRSDYVCMLENDVFVDPGWLEPLVEACETTGAGAAGPMLYEAQLDSHCLHAMESVGGLRRVATGGGAPRLEIVPAPLSELCNTVDPYPIESFEAHCALFRREALERVGGFDEALNTREWIDLCLAFQREGLPVVLAPASRVTFQQPPPIHPDERDYYFFHWDLERAEASHQHILEKWGLEAIPGSMDFIEGRLDLAAARDPEEQLRPLREYRTELRGAMAEITEVTPEGASLILVDQGEWNPSDVAPGRHTRPFTERDGKYWGPPADDAAALAELERLRQEGAAFVVFGQPAFWWLDHYEGLRRHLRSRFRCVRESERIVAFDLGA